MRKARLGFEIYSLEDELLVDEDKDFERQEKDKIWASQQKSKARKLRCYNKNKEKYNAQRRAKAATIAGRYLQAKKKATDLAQGWNMTQTEWEGIWMSAGWIIVPGTVGPSNPKGKRSTAYAMRGPNKLTNTMMARRDLAAPWAVDNCYIVFRSEPLSESVYHVTMGL